MYQTPVRLRLSRIREEHGRIMTDKIDRYSYVRDRLRDARNLKRTGRLNEAERILREALDAFVDDLFLRVSLADCYVRQRRPGPAATLIEQLLAEDPGNTAVLYVAGRLHASQGRHAEAQAYFDEAFKVDEAGYLAIGRARALSELGRQDEAVETLDRARAREPENGAVLRERGRLLMKTGRWDEAAAAFEELHGKKPDDEAAFAAMVACRGRDREPRAFAEELERILSLPSKAGNIRLRFLLAEALDEAGLRGEAIGQLDECLRLRPGRLDVLRDVGFKLNRMKEHGRAAEVLGKAFLEEPGNNAVRTTMQAAYRRAGDLEGLVALLRRAVERHPGERSLWGMIKKAEKELAAKG